MMMPRGIMWHHVASCGILAQLPCLELTRVKQELWGSSLRAAAHRTVAANVAFFLLKAPCKVFDLGSLKFI